GEFYHTLKRPEDALATWNEIAAGKNRNAKSLARLAEVLSGFGYLKEAIATSAEACKLEGDDFNLHVRHAGLLHQAERFDAALEELEVAAKLAGNAEENEEVLQEQIKNYQAKDSLPAEADALQKELTAGKDATARRWLRLARFREALRQYP